MHFATSNKSFMYMPKMYWSQDTTLEDRTQDRCWDRFYSVYFDYLIAITRQGFNQIQDLPINTERLRFTKKPLMRIIIECPGKVAVYCIHYFFCCYGTDALTNTRQQLCRSGSTIYKTILFSWGFHKFAQD